MKLRQCKNIHSLFGVANHVLTVGKQVCMHIDSQGKKPLFVRANTRYTFRSIRQCATPMRLR